MAIISISYQQYYNMTHNIPQRRYRELRDGLVVLEREAQDLRIGKRKTLSRAYRFLNRPKYNFRSYGPRTNLAVISTKQKLEKIADLCVRE
jgi:hypothetical protein